MALSYEPDTPEELNLTPFVDIVFNLLIFFLLGATYARQENQLDLQLPKVAAASPLTSAGEELTIEVLADGVIMVRGQKMTATELAAFLKDKLANFPDQAVAVRGDARGAYDHVAKVFALCQGAGVRRVAALVLED